MRNPDAIGVIVLGHSSGVYDDLDRHRGFHATGIYLGKTYQKVDIIYDASNAIDNLGVKAKFIGIFGCDSKSAAPLLKEPNSSAEIVAVDSGNTLDNTSSIHSMSIVAYVAAESLIQGNKNIFGQLSTAFNNVNGIRKIGTKTYNAEPTNLDDKLVKI